VSHATYTNRFHELARLAPYLVTLENERIKRYIYGLALHIRAMVAVTEPTTIKSIVIKVGMLTDEAIRNGSLKKNTEKRGNGGEPSRDGNFRDDNKRSRTGREFATTTNSIRKEYTGTAPKCTNCNYHHLPETPCRTCTNYNRFGHFAKDCMVGLRMVNPLNARNSIAARGVCFECGGIDHYKAACPRLNLAPGQGGNHLNQVLAVDRGQGHGNNGNLAHEKAFMLGAEEARQDPNIMMGMFTLNNHYATTLFDSGADYSFVSTTFIPLLDIEPSNLGFSYEMEIASRQPVEINKVIRVRIRLSNDEMLRVLGERTEEKVRHLMSAKAKEQKLKDIIVVRNFSEGEERERAFQTLKDKLCNAPVLALPDRPEDFVVYCNASCQGLGCVLMQRGKVIAYASRQLKIVGN
ncbi:putative reverse transcriptase domain-containing protein, partial [Tanacetum coccineum]